MTNRKTKILHIVYSLNPGGVESFLLQLAREIDRSSHEFHIAVCQRGELDDKLKEESCSIVYLGSFSSLLYYLKIYKYIKSNKIDILHCHVRNVCGFLSLISFVLRKPFIMHSHSDQVFDSSVPWLWKKLGWFNVKLANRFLAYGIGVSKRACSAFFGNDYKDNPKIECIHLGVNFKSFNPFNVNQSLKNYLGIKSENKVIANVGGLRYPKNHLFIIEIVREIIKINPNIHVLFVGDGSLRRQIEGKISEYGLNSYFSILGFVHNVPEILISCVDLLLFPSRFEGLGLALVEAQAAGVSCLYSDVIPEEAVINKRLMYPCSLSSPPAIWASKAISILSDSIDIKKDEAFNIAMDSSLNIEKTILRYERIWKDLTR